MNKVNVRLGAECGGKEKVEFALFREEIKVLIPVCSEQEMG